MDEKSDFLPNKCGRRFNGGVDMISELPDEIIIHILSFLRLKKAATTSVLSSRWLDLWKHIPHLKFDSYILPDNETNLGYARRCKCIEIVNTVIQSYKALFLKKIRLALHVNKSDKCAVTKWLAFVFSRQVDSLELKLICREEDDNFVLGELLRESRICLQPQTDLIFFQSLKRLRLKYLKVSGEDIELFLRTCPLLEQLTIRDTLLTSDVVVCGEKLMLKHLDIYNCKGQKSVKVYAPNLTYIKFDTHAVKLLFENAPKLFEVYFTILCPDIVQHFAPSTSCYFSQLQILKLFLLESKLLFQLQDILANGFQMPNLKKLVIICLEMDEHSFLPASALIWEFPRLEEFKLKYTSFREYRSAYMQVITDVGRSPHQHLKVFELQMSRQQNVSDDDITQLVIYVSNNCVALREIIIDRCSTIVDPATRDLITQRLQGKVPDHIQLELFNSSL